MNHRADATFFDGRLSVAQPDRGYRYSIDAVLLAGRPRPKPGERLVDLGAGCGIISLILAYRHPGVTIQAVEIQPVLARYANENIRSNQMSEQVSVIQMDMRRLHEATIGGPADWIVSNPPYHRANSGRINPSTQKAQARHEINIDLSELLMTARRLLRTGGRYCTIYPADRLVDLMATMREIGIEPKWMQSVHSHVGDEAKLVMLEGVKGGNAGIKVAAPLVIYAADGVYSKAVQGMMMP